MMDKVVPSWACTCSFGGVSPERAGSRALRNLFTFIAARIVLSQLEGSGRGSLAAYDAAAYNDLLDFLQTEKMVDCDEWLAQLKRKNSGLGKCQLVEVGQGARHSCDSNSGRAASGLHTINHRSQHSVCSAIALALPEHCLVVL
jgi:hypothetical protein